MLLILLYASYDPTEVYICGWWFGEYDCKLIDHPQETNNEWDPYTSSKSDELQGLHFLFPKDSND